MFFERMAHIIDDRTIHDLLPSQRSPYNCPTFRIQGFSLASLQDRCWVPSVHLKIHSISVPKKKRYQLIEDTSIQ